MTAPSANASIARRLADFTVDTQASDIPAAIRERAKYLILDAVGIAWASTHFDFAHRSLSAIAELSGGQGDAPVIGLPHRLQARDAMLMNGLLIHGLDFDDTHPGGVIHATASCFPAALGAARQTGASGADLLTAYVIGIEAATRLGAVAKGGFHQVGFHPTGLVGTFGCALAAGALLGLTAEQLAMAQGISLSVAAGSLEFLQDGAWTKRMHPGWAAVAGLTAATFARHGYIGPQATYEGRFGLYASHLGPLMEQADLGLATAGLGERWELDAVSIKPIPACHFTHACADAAAILRDKHSLKPGDIESVRALIPQEVVKTVCEPVSTKQKPQNSYDAQFSIPYTVATGLVHGSFGLQHLEDAALADPVVSALAHRVQYEVDPDSPFPRSYSGEVIVTTRDGRQLRHRETVNRGAADRPLSGSDIEQKFMGNATLATTPGRAEALMQAVLTMDQPSVRATDLATALSARPC